MRGPGTIRTIGADDLHLLAEGTHARLFNKLGAQLLEEGGVQFAVWAPNARRRQRDRQVERMGPV